MVGSWNSHVAGCEVNCKRVFFLSECSNTPSYLFPSCFEISALWMSGLSSTIFFRSMCENTMKAFIGRFMWFGECFFVWNQQIRNRFLFSVLRDFQSFERFGSNLVWWGNKSFELWHTVKMKEISKNVQNGWPEEEDKIRPIIQSISVSDDILGLPLGLCA